MSGKIFKKRLIYCITPERDYVFYLVLGITDQYLKTPMFYIEIQIFSDFKNMVNEQISHAYNFTSLALQEVIIFLPEIKV